MPNSHENDVGARNPFAELRRLVSKVSDESDVWPLELKQAAFPVWRWIMTMQNHIKQLYQSPVIADLPPQILTQDVRRLVTLRFMNLRDVRQTQTAVVDLRLALQYLQAQSRGLPQMPRSARARASFDISLSEAIVIAQRVIETANNVLEQAATFHRRPASVDTLQSHLHELDDALKRAEAASAEFLRYHSASQ